MHDLETVEPHGSADLLHLLTCPACRSVAIGRLLDQQSGTRADDTTEDVYTHIWDRLARKTPAMIAESRRRREAVERLLRELIEVPSGQQKRLLHQRRFRSLDLLDRLLEESHARQLSEPAAASQLADLAVGLARDLEGPEQGSEALLRALCLGANARRLEGRASAAEELLTEVGPVLTSRMERAFYCRILALLRWEGGRFDEAEALFRHAACLCSADGLRHEVGVCWTLLGLLFHLDGGDGSALSLLARGWAEIDRDHQPLLALRGGLALAACMAEVGQAARADSVMGEAWRLYSRVSDSKEMLRVYWAEGRVLVYRGKHDEAVHMLESVWRQLVAEPAAAEAVLVTADLMLALGRAGRRQEIPALVEELASAVPDHPALAARVDLLRVLAVSAEGEFVETVYATGVTLRRGLRTSGLWIKPLPVA